MHGSFPNTANKPSIVPVITADALRSAIRAGELLREVRSYGSSLPRGLRGHSSVALLHAELVRLRGLGDLVTPVSTTGETRQRLRRLDALFALLPPETTLVQVAQNARVSMGEPGLSPSLRGQLTTADERDLQAMDKKVVGLFADQLQTALVTLQHESADWRLLEHSGLANRLIADHGFANTYGQARKCARGLIKAQAHSGKGVPRLGELKVLGRWHASVEVQLRALARAGALHSELEQLSQQVAVFGGQLTDRLALMRLRRVSGIDKDWKARLAERLEGQTAELLVSLQQIYGLSKTNFRAFIVSELA